MAFSQGGLFSGTESGCKVCGGLIPEDRERRHSKFCCTRCGLKSKRIAFKSRWPDISTGNVGAISELIICADLLGMGYDVYRAVSPASPCDLAAFKGGRLTRVEVTTGHLDRLGRLIHKQKDRSRFDVLAVVFERNRIQYVPNAGCEFEKEQEKRAI